MTEKPLFIPLKTEFFEAFSEGVKDMEYRLYGPRWNSWTCHIHRAVTLSKGYGKHARLSGRISSFAKVGISNLPQPIQESLHNIYGDKAETHPIACIGIDLS